MAEKKTKKELQNKLGKSVSLKFTKEKILAEKQNILKIVERMLEKNVSKEWFLNNCEKLSQADYADVIEERNIDLLCGYPLCFKNIKVLKQQYHISAKLNKVYDITERKYFCSNECYKASNYVKAQLSTDSFWMREDSTLELKLLSELENRGSAGEEVDMGYCTRMKAEKELHEESTSYSPSELLKKEVDKCSEDLKDLKIVENTFQTAYKFQVKESTNTEDFEDSPETDSSTESLEDSSDESDPDKKISADYDNAKAFSDKLMPVPLKSQKAVLIPPRSSTIIKCEVDSKTLSLRFAHLVLTSWFTEDTIKYLIGEHKMHSLKADILFVKMTSTSDLSPEDLKSMKDEYVELCLRLDKEELGIEDELIDDIGSISLEQSACEKVSQPEVRALKPPQSRKKSNKKVRKKKSVGNNKTVTFASSTKDEPCDTPESKENLTLSSLPLIGSKSQNSFRKQIVINRLKIAYTDMLPLIGQTFKIVSQEIRSLVETFSLSPSNVTYKPKEWKLLALIIYRMLSRTVNENICDTENFIMLFERTKLPIGESLDAIDEIIQDISGVQQLRRLQGFCDQNTKDSTCD